ncbi:MAG: hypothetical protein IT350_00180 [Deltaproteobacteria bacterium]|nr:hypothetical protein [Deltaproteobacteria bacterium]
MTTEVVAVRAKEQLRSVEMIRRYIDVAILLTSYVLLACAFGCAKSTPKASLPLISGSIPISLDEKLNGSKELLINDSGNLHVNLDSKYAFYAGIDWKYYKYPKHGLLPTTATAMTLHNNAAAVLATQWLDSKSQATQGDLVVGTLQGQDIVFRSVKKSPDLKVIGKYIDFDRNGDERLIYFLGGQSESDSMSHIPFYYKRITKTDKDEKTIGIPRNLLVYDPVFALDSQGFEYVFYLNFANNSVRGDYDLYVLSVGDQRKLGRSCRHGYSLTTSADGIWAAYTDVLERKTRVLHYQKGMLSEMFVVDSGAGVTGVDVAMDPDGSLWIAYLPISSDGRATNLNVANLRGETLKKYRLIENSVVGELELPRISISKNGKTAISAWSKGAGSTLIYIYNAPNDAIRGLTALESVEVKPEKTGIPAPGSKE